MKCALPNWYKYASTSSRMRVLEGRSTTRPVAQAGGVLQLRDDVNCVLHTHIPASTVAATLEDGLMPVIQHALIVFNQIVYVDCDIGNDDDAVRDIVNKMNGKKIAMIRNHGILVAAGSVAGILFLTITLEYACKYQLSALQTGQNLLPFDNC